MDAMQKSLQTVYLKLIKRFLKEKNIAPLLKNLKQSEFKEHAQHEHAECRFEKEEKEFWLKKETEKIEDKQVKIFWQKLIKKEWRKVEENFILKKCKKRQRQIFTQKLKENYAEPKEKLSQWIEKLKKQK